MLGLRKRRAYDLRRTFISLARTDGADRDKLKAVTHGPSGEILDLYTTWPWETLCAEIAKLRVQRREGLVLALSDPATAEQVTFGSRFLDRARKRWSQVPDSVLVSKTEARLALVTGTVFKTDGAS